MNTQLDDDAGGRPPIAVPLAEIDDTDRLRPVDPTAVEQVRRSFVALGQKTAIEVTGYGADGRRRLISGAHRVAAARALGWTTISAVELQGSDDELRLHEIDENLVRNELNPFDQAVFLAERAAIYRRMHPETTHGGDRKSKKNKDKGSSTQSAHLIRRTFAEDVAERIGFSPATVRRALARYERLSPQVRALVRGSEIAANGAALDALLKVPTAQQSRFVRDVLERDINAPLAARMVAARERVLGVRRQVPDRVAGVKAAYDRLGPEERAAFIDWLRATGQLGRRAAAGAA